MVEYAYDEENDILIVKVSGREYCESAEYGDVCIDYNKDGEFSGLRVFGAKEKLR